MTAQAPPTSSGVAPLAEALASHRDGIAALEAGSNGFILNPSTGNATVVWGPDISHAPINQNTANPGTESTGLSGPGIATKKSGSWVQIA